MSTAAQTQETFLLRLMRMGYFADFYVYPIAAVTFLLLAIFMWHTSWLLIIVLLIAGYGLWGIMEYFMHRYAFHHAPVFRDGHGEHHKHPTWHIGTPFFITLPVYVLVGWLLALRFGYGPISALQAGFIGGYFGYLIVHHVVHNKKIRPGSFWHRFKKFHDIHHYTQTVNFGVSWHLWDRVFGTYQKSH